MQETDQIKAVSVISRGTVTIHPEHFLSTRLPFWVWVLTSRKWIKCPVNIFLIEHADSLVLFDTGLDQRVQTDKHYYPRGIYSFFYHHLARLNVRGISSLSEAIEKLGYSIHDIKKVVYSHLHYDHIGGLRELKHAEHVVSEEEWKNAHRLWAKTWGYFPAYIVTEGIKWNPIIFHDSSSREIAPFKSSYDLMGDGSLLLISTPGHTAGSLSMVVNRKNKKSLLLVGDVCYGADALEQGYFHNVGNKNQIRAISKKILELKENLSAVILASHDPRAKEMLDVSHQI